MTLDKRDWQKDMELLQKKPKFTIDEVNYIIYSIAPHWMKEAQVYKQSYEGTLREYEAEKARADGVEAQLHTLQIVANSEARRADRWRLGYKGLNDSLNAAEAREQRMKEAIELLLFMFRFDPEEGQAYINFGDYEEPLEIDDNSAYITASNIFFTLYPDTPAPAAPKEGDS